MSRGLSIKRASILAAIEGRDFVIPDDFKEIAVPVLEHRIRLTPEAQISDMTEAEVITAILDQTGPSPNENQAR